MDAIVDDVAHRRLDTVGEFGPPQQRGRNGWPVRLPRQMGAHGPSDGQMILVSVRVVEPATGGGGLSEVLLVDHDPVGQQRGCPCFESR